LLVGLAELQGRAALLFLPLIILTGLILCNACSESGITNGLEVFESPLQGTCVVASNNDALVRVYQACEDKIR
jgi:hypothetical protein